eukprot:6207376-Pleurochrysis_carterae.AAC.2
MIWNLTAITIRASCAHPPKRDLGRATSTSEGRMSSKITMNQPIKCMPPGKEVVKNSRTPEPWSGAWLRLIAMLNWL